MNARAWLSVSWMLLICFASSDNVYANSGLVPETEIRILAIYDGSGSTDITAIQNLLSEIETAWNGSHLNTTATVQILNGGLPIPVPLFSSSGSIPVQLASAKFAVEATIPPLLSIRDQFHADIVLAFGSVSGGCGKAPSRFVNTGVWDPDQNTQLDLNGADDSYIGVVAVGPSCQGSRTLNTTAAHEFGHLLGAQHANVSSNQLFVDTFAYIRVQLFPIFNSWIRVIDASVVTKTSELLAACAEPLNSSTRQGRCLRIPTYSNMTFGADVSRNNAKAIDLTALSLANYRSGGVPSGGPPTQCNDGVDNDGDNLVDSADPDCSGPSDDDETGPPPAPAPPGCNPLAYPPVNVSARPLDICHPPSGGSLWDISWNHACPPDYFIVYGNQAGSISSVGPIFGFSVTIFVAGTPAAVTVRACQGFFCSPPSSPPVYVFDTC